MSPKAALRMTNQQQPATNYKNNKPGHNHHQLSNKFSYSELIPSGSGVTSIKQ